MATILPVRTVVWLTAFLILCAGSAHAANRYVRPNGSTYGAGNGTDWNNAYSGFSGIAWASVAPGDTIWVAGGNYSQDLIPAKSGTSGSLISVRRARSDASECTGAAGWSSSFDATVHQVRQGITFNSFNFITVSGRTTAAGGTYGWWIDFQGTTSGLGIEWPNGSNGSNILVEYMDVQGPGVVTYSGDGRGIDDTPFSSATNHTFSHIAIHDWESAVYTAGMSRPTFEWLDVYDIMAVNWSAFHPNGIFTNSTPGGTVRYSRFHRGPKGNGMGEGIFFEQGGGSTGWMIYGNVFYDLNSEGWKSIEITANVGPIKIYNNTFDNTGVPGVYVNQGSCGSGSETRNNLGFQTTFDSCGTSSNNQVTASTSVWVNRAARDYHIVSNVGAGFPRNTGTNLSSVFTTDPDGVVYGADGTWDVGAYEFAGGGNSAPSAPTNLRIVP